MNPRLVAAHIIQKVTKGRSLTECLDEQLSFFSDPRDRAFVQAICYGVCRFYFQLNIILNHLLSKPMKMKDADVRALLLVGLYQLTAMRVPTYAAVTETVSATARLHKPWARALVNAVMRSYLRQHDELAAIVKMNEEACYAHPKWWIDALRQAWPEHWQSILKHNNDHPPFVVRVNQQRVGREEYQETLKQAGYAVQSLAETDSGLILKTPVVVESLPGFAEGNVSVQDGAAQLAAALLALKPKQHVLDACAAPGGKLTHLLEIEPSLSVIAIEKASSRMASIRQNLTRLNMHADCICADATETKSWWNGKYFDRILLDAPCSASGVVRRHPDIKLLRRKADIKNMATEQSRLLEALWPLLKPGGLLLYCTCSVFPEENTVVIRAFLDRHPDASEELLNATWGLPCDIGRQILPGMHQMDGFYYARLRKGGEAEQL